MGADSWVAYSQALALPRPRLLRSRRFLLRLLRAGRIRRLPRRHSLRRRHRQSHRRRVLQLLRPLVPLRQRLLPTLLLRPRGAPVHQRLVRPQVRVRHRPTRPIGRGPRLRAGRAVPAPLAARRRPAINSRCCMACHGAVIAPKWLWRLGVLRPRRRRRRPQHLPRGQRLPAAAGPRPLRRHAAQELLRLLLASRRRPQLLLPLPRCIRRWLPQVQPLRVRG